MTIWDFAVNAPFLFTICVITIGVVITCPFRYAFCAYNRRLRSKNIAAHGWPTAPIDADGDVIYPREKES